MPATSLDHLVGAGEGNRGAGITPQLVTARLSRPMLRGNPAHGQRISGSYVLRLVLAPIKGHWTAQYLRTRCVPGPDRHALVRSYLSVRCREIVWAEKLLFCGG